MPLNKETGLGKQAISFWIDKHPDTLHQRLNKNFIIEGIEIILNNNSFQFNNINYIQTLGTAMGTKMAPTYFTLTLAYLEENLYEIVGKKLSNDIKEDFTKSWKRYLDDCFIFWKYPWWGESTNSTNYYKTYPHLLWNTV